MFGAKVSDSGSLLNSTMLHELRHLQIEIQGLCARGLYTLCESNLNKCNEINDGTLRVDIRPLTRLEFTIQWRFA